MRSRLPLIAAALAAMAVSPLSAQKIAALIVDGQNNHKWQETTPILQSLLEQTGIFRVDVATSPPAGADMSGFSPDFAKYKVVVSNYNGEPWPAKTLDALAEFVRKGGGFVSYHAADNAFPESKEYNEMIALGGWGDRDEKSGAMLRFHNGAIVRDPSPGKAGHHGARLPFLVTVRDPNHPITSGLPKKWMHAADELYDSLRGPGENVTLLATAFSNPDNKGTGEDEPVLFTIAYGRGRVFHTTLGHDATAMACVGFISTFQRGTEWAATGKVTLKPPMDFPSSDSVRTR